MKPVHGIVFALVLSTIVFACMTVWSVWHMAGLYDRIHKLESPTRNEIRELQQVTKSDPLRNFTAEEANEWLQYCEDTLANRKKWAEAGTPMMESDNN